MPLMPWARVGGRSLLGAGDFAGVSFHATKVFNSFEGGAVFSRSGAGKREVDLARNIGIADEVTVLSTGVNAEMSERHAAVALLQLARFEQAIAARGSIDHRYREALADLSGIEPLARPTGWSRAQLQLLSGAGRRRVSAEARRDFRSAEAAWHLQAAAAANALQQCEPM